MLKRLIIDKVMKVFFCWFITDKVQAAIREALVAQEGIGLHYKIVERKKDIVFLATMNGLAAMHEAQEVYDIYADRENRIWYVCSNNVIVLCNKSEEHNVLEEITEYFLRHRHYISVIKMAALGQWTAFRLHVEYNWKDIVQEMCD